jgi:predicted nucleic acid-binding Zn ribbon protein
MQRAGNILKKFIRDYGLEAGPKLSAIKRQWVTLVGQTIAMHSFPDIITGSVLIITVDTPQWMHHLSFYKHDILDRLGAYNIKEIRFKLGKLPERKVESRDQEDSRLTEEDLSFIENTVKTIKDNELKQKLTSLLTRAFGRGRK